MQGLQKNFFYQIIKYQNNNNLTAKLDDFSNLFTGK